MLVSDTTSRLGMLKEMTAMTITINSEEEAEDVKRGLLPKELYQRRGEEEK